MKNNINACVTESDCHRPEIGTTLQINYEHESFTHSVVSNSLSMDCSLSRLLCPWNSPSKNTGVGCHALLQEDLPDPGIEPSSPTIQTVSSLFELPVTPFPVKGTVKFGCGGVFQQDPSCYRK